MIQRLTGLTLTQFKQLAARLGREYRQQALTIGLIGPLGSGKTTFVKNFARSLGIRKITSPTFTIVSNFRIQGRQFHHMDFYRLNHISELDPLGVLPTLRQGTGLVIIEWVDKFPILKKYCDVIIKISFSERPYERSVTIQKK